MFAMLVMLIRVLLLLGPKGLWGIAIISVCLSVHPHFQSTQYLTNAELEKGDMLRNYAPWGDLDAY